MSGIRTCGRRAVMNVCDLFRFAHVARSAATIIQRAAPHMTKCRRCASGVLGRRCCNCEGSSGQPEVCAGSITRVEETMGLRTQRLPQDRRGVLRALHDEARAFCGLLRNCGFAVESVICKNGSLPADFYETVSCARPIRKRRASCAIRWVRAADEPGGHRP
jgi:hypothetical protein